MSCHHLAPDLAHLYDKSTIVEYPSVDCLAVLVDNNIHIYLWYHTIIIQTYVFTSKSVRVLQRDVQLIT
jgi:hypothetical protein